MMRRVTVYEVTLEIDADVFEAFRVWLRGHVQEILSLPGFIGAELFERDEPAAAAGQRGLCVVYRLVDQAALERYLRDDAPRLRADGQARFGGRFSASRRVLQLLLI